MVTLEEGTQVILRRMVTVIEQTAQSKQAQAPVICAGVRFSLPACIPTIQIPPCILQRRMPNINITGDCPWCESRTQREEGNGPKLLHSTSEPGLDWMPRRRCL